jgi:hypothetical protein
MFRTLRYIGIVFIMGALLFTACSVGGVRTPTTDPQAIYTSAAKTVGAELTQSGALTPSATFTTTITETETTVPTSVTVAPTVNTPTLAATQPSIGTPTIANVPDKAEFVSQAVADGTKFNPGNTIAMKWVIKNIGTTTWTTAYTAKFYAGDQMSAAPTFAFTQAIKPGDTIEVAVNFTAPNSLGKKSSIWVLQNANGINFYPFYLNIEIVAAPPTKTPVPPTITPTPQPTSTITTTPQPSITPPPTLTPTV